MTTEEMKPMTFEEMIEKITFKSLEMVPCGSGWVGTRYILRTHSYGDSGVCETMQEVREWIVKNLAWQLRI